jgi:hypothetical protein
MRPIGIALLSAALLVGGGTLYFGEAQEAGKNEAIPKPEARADVDLVLCLDTSNSMDGLINAAKQKLWDIVNTLAKAKPTPSLRVALYSYGNDGYDAKKGWVRKELDFTADLDKIFEKLFELRTYGGTEYATRVSHDAIMQQKWSPKPEALKMIFVCGNEPADQDPTISLKAVAELAIKNGINLNTIYCGGADDPDCRTWRELAALAKSQFSSINQSQHIAMETPFDKKLAEFADAINKTYVPYGKAGKEAAANQKAQTGNSSSLGSSNIAGRVQLQASSLYFNADWDLVDKRKDDKKFDLSKVPVDDLPPNMQKMTPKERVAYLDEMQRQREEIQKKVTELSRERDTYLRKELERLAPAEKAERFDAAIQGTIRKQAEAKKIEIPK